MKKSKIILIAVYAIVALAVFYFTYGVVKKRYVSPAQQNIQTLKSEMQNSRSVDQSGNLESSDQGATSPDSSTSDSENAAAEGSHLYVTNKDCDNNCDKFKDNMENLKYCQEICGIIPADQKNSEEDCANLSGLEKDYCWRDLAVSKKDFSICDKIGDKKFQIVCRNRVAEEVLN